jgi:hypothetical protein
VITQTQAVFVKYAVSANDLQWTGRPPTGLRLHRGDVFQIPFSLMWGGFAVFWEYSVVVRGSPLMFKLWGVPFVAVGIYITVGRFFWNAYVRSRTYYGLMSNSALILVDRPGGGITRFHLPALKSIGFELCHDGSGTISFGDGSTRRNWDYWSGGTLAPSFEGIPDARHVYELCVAAQHAAS